VIFPTSSISALLPEFESDTMTTCDDLCDECDHQLTNLVGHNIKKIEKRSSKGKKYGKVSRSVFLDVFRPPDHNSSVHFP